MNCKNCGYGLKQSSGDFEKIICTYEEGECVKITELEKENAELKEQNTNLQEMLKTERSVTCKEEYLKKVTELEHENAKLEKRCADYEMTISKMEKGTCDICKETEKDNKIAKLEQENAELKAVERMALYSRMSDRLAKAEELLLELYDCIPSSMADSCKETLQKVALFFKDSEVEK